MVETTYLEVMMQFRF